MDEINKWQKKFQNYFYHNPCSDGSHDLEHFNKVWKNAQKLMEAGADQLIILAAAYFHDIVNYPKNHPSRSQSSKEAALKAEEILLNMDFPKVKIKGVKHCIESHSFSSGISPSTLEAKILQDSDRIEALGAIGIARTFYVAGQLNSKLFDARDPLGKNRILDDKQYALDHFQIKLLKLPETMQTEKGKIEASRRASILTQFMINLQEEL